MVGADAVHNHVHARMRDEVVIPAGMRLLTEVSSDDQQATLDWEPQHAHGAAPTGAGSSGQELDHRQTGHRS